MTVYMAVTPDKYELPLFLSDTQIGLAKITGYSADIIKSCISRGDSGRMRGMKFLRVAIEEDT